MNAATKTRMTGQDARAIFDLAYAAEHDPDRRAEIELMREYFCNPQFRHDLADHLWANRI
jgi:uncharacterized membrane-anchored protein YjiN (DUF445 family)